MRSRYTAHVVRDEAYLLCTWHPSTRPTTLDLRDTTAWLGLTVHATTGGGPLEPTGTVEFTARYADGDGPEHELHEVSRFERLDGAWLYVSA